MPFLRRFCQVLFIASAVLSGTGPLWSQQTAPGDGQGAPPQFGQPPSGGFPGGGFPGGPGGGGRERGRGRGGFGTPGIIGQALRPEVQTELKLTEQQIAVAQAFVDEQRAAMQGNFARFQGLSDEERTATFEKMRQEGEAARKAGEAKLKAALSAEQAARLVQLDLQQTGLSALAQDEVAAALKLTDDQKAQIKKVLEESAGGFGAPGGGAPGGFGGGFGGFTRMSAEDREKRRQEREAKLLAVLTPEQSQQWTVKIGPVSAASPAWMVAAGTTTPAPASASGTPPASSAPPTTVAATPAPTTPATTPPGTAPLTPPGTVPAASTPATVPVNGQVASGAIPGPTGVPVTGATSTVMADLGPQAKPNVEAAQAGKKMSFNFRFAPWDLVLKRFAEEAGLTLDLAAVPPGTFNYYDSGKYNATEALDILNGYLLQKGYILVRRDQFLVSLSLDNPVPPNLVPQVTVDELKERGKNELLSVVFPLTGVDADSAAAEVKEMLGPQGKVVPLKKTGRLLVTDIGSNLRRMHTLLSESGSVQTGKGFKSFTLKHITASEADRIIRDLFGLQKAGSSTTSRSTPGQPQPWGGDQRRPEWGGRGNGEWRDGNGNPQQQPQPAPSANSQPADKILLAVDHRNNTLLVTASAEELALVEQAIKTIDVEESGSPLVGSRRSSAPQLEVYPLQTAETRPIVEMLNTLLPGLQISEDSKARRIGVYASPADQAQVREIVKQLDGSVGDSVTVVPLRRLDPVAAASSLKSLFANNRGDAPSIEADAIGRRLMVRGTPDQVSQIRAVLTQLGEDADGTGLLDGGPVRTLQLGGRDPQEMIQLLERIWGETETNPIRVVVPSAISPTVRDSRGQTAVEGDAAFERRTVNDNPIRPLRRSGEAAPLEEPARPLDREPTSGAVRSRSMPAVPASVKGDAETGTQSTVPATESRPRPSAALPSERRSTVTGGYRGPGLVKVSPASIGRLITASNAAVAADPDAAVVLEVAEEAVAPPASNPAKSGEPTPSKSGKSQEQEQIEAAKELLEILEGTQPSTPPAAKPAVKETMPTEGTKDEKSTGEQPAPQEGSEPAKAGAGQSVPGKATAGGKAPVVIAPSGSSLIISSDDRAALDRLEKLVGMLAQSANSKTRWTVFYLRTADATETATMLGNLFPTGSVTTSSSSSSMLGSIGGSLSSFGSGVMEMTGMNSLGRSKQVLRIIPDLRSNALFVSGPKDQVEEVEAVLKILDSNELPDSLRSRVPRMIPVEHADLDDVAAIIKDVYKEQLEAPLAIPQAGAQRGGQGFNPLAMIMGGMAAGGGKNGQNGVEMTLGVDHRTSSLVVSANDTLFRQVEALVKSLDAAALEARRTIRVVPLNSTSSQLVTQALGAMISKVKVTSTGSTTTSTRESSNAAAGRGGSASPAASTDQGGDPVRSFFEQRMRERMSGQGGFPGGGFPGGGFPGGGFPGGGFNRGGSGRGGERGNR